MELLVIRPLHRDADSREQLNHDLHVLDLRDVLQATLFIGQEARRQDRQDGILGPADGYSPHQSSSPLDPELSH